MAPPRAKPLGALVAVFGLVAALSAAIAIGTLVAERRFAAAALRADGIVTHIAWREGRGGRPVVRYVVEGKAYEIEGRTASKAPSHAPGDRVEVLYLPEEPERGRIASFGDRYLITLVFGLFAAVFGAIAGGLAIARARFVDPVAQALTFGVPVEARIVHLERADLPGAGPRWFLDAEYEDPSGRKLEFTTDFASDDPAPYREGGTVTVYYVPDRPEAYAFADERLRGDPAAG